MVILNLWLNNIYSFNDFNVNFSYSKKQRNSLIDNENLNDIPSFRYKKLNVFIGSSSTGKTTLIRAIYHILRFLDKGESEEILKMVNPKSSDGFIVLDLVDNNELDRIKIRIDLENDDIALAYNKLSLKNNDSYENRSLELDSLLYEFKDYRASLDELNLSPRCNNVIKEDDEVEFLSVPLELQDDYLDILYNVLSTLDSSIKDIYKSEEADNTYLLVHEVGNIILRDGDKLSDIKILSSSTKYGISLANLIYSVKHHLNDIYLIDKAILNINSDLLKAILAVIISHIESNEQLFISTANSEILTMSLPIHSIYFMKKVDNIISIDCASSYSGKNKLSPLDIYNNDLFLTSANLDNIYKMGK